MYVPPAYTGIAPLTPGLSPDRPTDAVHTETPDAVKPVPETAETILETKSPADFWRVPNGGTDPDTHTAPPSIMQLKILEILDQQQTVPSGSAPPAPKDSPPAAPASARPSDPFDPIAALTRDSAFTAPDEDPEPIPPEDP
ncbi:hypothetical protein [Aestuariicoccus sp. MJ-SS9]|uniref:hypothetical protein n=1 Tax=Aestuariicoccus sp. MJ-SS9 TaxID=3079855 RepID=UPI00290ED910|nr:hypothetical protein [Aestuariicoccus sp. MJ-SS9]MDU8911182.1 hypothetical protein [Aestuariicoccus sp. MJ-SS9]